MERTGIGIISDSGDALVDPGADCAARHRPLKWGTNPLDYWSKMVTKQAESQLTVKAFCKEEGFSTCSFYTWRKRLHPDCQEQRSFSDRKNFVELVAEDSDSGIRVTTGTPIPISVARGFDPETFRSALSVVRDTLP